MAVKTTMSVMNDGGGGSTSGAVGFNLKAANQLVEDLKADFKTHGTYTQNELSDLKKILRAEWVGPDEVDFEYRLQDRLEQLEKRSEELVGTVCKNVATLATEWDNFQKKNLLGSSSVGISLFDAGKKANNILKDLAAFTVTAPLKIGNSIVKSLYKNGDKFFTPVAKLVLSEGDFRGLVHGDKSRSRIRDAFETFVKQVNSRLSTIFNKIDSGKAFMGSQVSSISKLISSTGDAISVVATSVKDLDAALDNLAKTNYSSASSSIASAATQAANSITNSTSDLKNSKWV